MQNPQPQTSDLQEAHTNNPLPQPSLPQNPIHPTIFHKIKPIFKQIAAWRCTLPSDISYINKYKPKMLSQISISKALPEKIGLRKLRKALVDSKRASSLTLNETDLTPKQLTYLFYSTNLWRKFSFHFSPYWSAETVSRLGRCKNLELFPLGEKEAMVSEMSIYKPTNAKLFTRIHRQSRELKKMKSLVLNVPFYINAPIKPARSLRDLHIVFQNNDTFNKTNLSKFISSLRKCNQMEHLMLTFSSMYRIEASDVRILTSFFQHLSSPLKKLTLGLIFNHQQLKQIQSFIESLRYLKELTSLDFSFQSDWRLNHIEDNLFPSLFNAIQSLTQLQNLKLSLRSFPILKDNHLKQLDLMLQSLKNLKDLQISLPSLESPDEALVSISQKLKDIIHLNTLDIRFPQTDLSHKSMEIFSKNICHHHLTSLSLSHGIFDLDLPDISVTSAIKSGVNKLVNLLKTTTLTPFFVNLSHLIQLSQLELRLSAFDISPQEWKEFSLTLRKLPNLSSITLILPKFDSAKNFEGLQNLFSCFQDLPKLAHLSLAFKKETGDQEVSILAPYLARCKSLRTLTLQFKESSELKDESLYSLLPGIRGLLALENLQLEFWKEKSFGEKATIEFLEGLTGLKRLERLLFFGNTLANPYPPPVPLNIKKFENMRRLTVFNVNFYDLFEHL